MSRDPQSRQRSRIVFGAFIIVVGLFALLDNLHLFDSRVVQPFWPLIFVVMGGLHLANARRPRKALVGLVFIAVGAGMTLNNLGLIHVRMHDLWPVVLILVGLSVLLRPPRDAEGRRPGRSRHDQRDERFEHGTSIDASAMMSGLVLKNDSQEFSGGEINAVMGAVEIDLRQAAIATEAVLHLSIIMGGVEIRVPREWSVVIHGSPMLGGIEDKTMPPMTPGKRLVIEGSVIMGGVEITN